MTMPISWLRFPRDLAKIILRFLFFIAVAGTSSSCLPGPHGAYYKPSYPDDSANLSRRNCHRQAGPISVIKIPIQGNSITLNLFKNSQGSLEMRLSTSGGSKLQFTTDVIRLTDLDTGREWTQSADIFHFAYWPGEVSYSEVDFVGRLPTTPENILNDMEVGIPFSVDDFSPDTVHVHLPLIVSGSKEYRVPPLVWKADKEGSHEKGWNWWSYTKEKVKVGSFTVGAGATGGFHGSSKIDDRLKVPKLNGNLFIHFPADTKWRFASNEIIFEDVSSGKSKRVYFQSLKNQSTLKVAFSAEFCCTNAWSETLLGKGEKIPDKILIELPQLLIDGKEFIIKPITFELHRFEFGIYPFNC